jgi:hypothetical protein
VSLVIVLILVVLWVVVLAPGLFKRLRQRAPSESIESFHHGLRLLERTGPNLVAPAFRLETAMAETGLAPGQSGYPAISSSPRQADLRLVRDEQRGATGYGSVRTDHHAARRRAARRRRRDLFAGLAATFLVTGALGFVHPLHVLWAMTVLCGLVLGGLVILAVYAQALALHGGAGRSAPRYGPRSAQPWREHPDGVTPLWDEYEPYDSHTHLDHIPVAVAR